MAFYQEMQDMVESMLVGDEAGGFGQGTIELVRLHQVRPANEWEVPPAPRREVTRLKGAVKGVSSKFVDNERILASDLEVTVAAKSVTFEPTDSLLLDGTPVTVLQVMAMPAVGVTVAYKLIVRK